MDKDATLRLRAVGNDLDNLIQAKPHGFFPRGPDVPETNQLFGLGGNDILIGNALDDFHYGGDGDDFLFGARGEDHLFGKPVTIGWMAAPDRLPPSG